MYMQEFTEEELVALKRFYETPVGKKAVRKLPVLKKQADLWGKKQLNANMGELKKMVEEEAKRRLAD
jgi:hypothetical protein